MVEVSQQFEVLFHSNKRCYSYSQILWFQLIINFQKPHLNSNQIGQTELTYLHFLTKKMNLIKISSYSLFVERLLVLAFFDIILMRNNQSKHNNNRSCVVRIDTLTVQLSFSCRLFAEYHLCSKPNKTKAIQVNPRQSHYLFNQSIFWENSHEKLPLIVTFKLLSNQGLEFTAGTIHITSAEIENSSVNYKVSRTAEVEIYCLCKFSLADEETTSRSLEDIQQDLTESSKLDVSMLHQSPRSYLPEASRFQRKLFSPMSLQTEKSCKRNIQEKLNFSPVNSEKDESYELKRQLEGQRDLWEKQREMYNLLEQKYRESLCNEEKLKIKLERSQLQLDQKSKRIAEIEDERIMTMKKQVEIERRLMLFRNMLKGCLDKLHQQIGRSFEHIRKHQTKGPTYKMTTSGHRQAHEGEVSPIISKDSSQQQIALDDSISYSKLIEDIQVDQQADNQLQGFISSAILGKQGFLKSPEIHLSMPQLDQCCHVLTSECFSINSRVKKGVFDMSKQLNKLGKSNRDVKKRLKVNRQEFQNSEESLLNHLEELEEALEKQLIINSEKQQAILGYMTHIEDLSEELENSETRVKQLEEEKIKNFEEKQFIKGQLHDNNYMFAVKEEHLIKKIQFLEATIEANSAPKKGGGEQLLQQYCSRLRDKEMQLLQERRQSHRLLELIQNGESAKTKRAKLELSFEKDKSLVESIDNSFHEEMAPQKMALAEEQFLRVLT